MKNEHSTIFFLDVKSIIRRLGKNLRISMKSGCKLNKEVIFTSIFFKFVENRGIAEFQNEGFNGIFFIKICFLNFVSFILSIIEIGKERR